MHIQRRKKAESFTDEGRRIVKDSPNEGWPGLTSRVTEIQNQGQVAVVNSDTGDIDDASNALLVDGSMYVPYGCCGESQPTLDSSDSWYIMAVQSTVGWGKSGCDENGCRRA